MAEIELKINANIKDAVVGIEKTQGSLEDLNESYEEVGVTSQKAFSASNDEIKTQNELIQDTEKELKDLEKQQKKTQDPRKLKKYNEQIEKGKRKLQEYKTKGVPAIKRVNKEAGVGAKIFGKLGGVIAGAFAVGTVVSFVKNIVNVRKEFEKFEAVLTNTLGSKSAAQAALGQIQQFASETPFQVSQLTDSFVKLANQGFIPTTDELRKLGDLASSTGKDFDQLTEAIIDAQVGEFERLKEFGIRASKQGDQVKFTFKGVQEQVQFTDTAIRDYILSLGDAEGVSGSMAAISETLGGRISNMGDSWDRFLNTLGSTGPFAEVAQTSLKLITESLNQMSDVMESEVLTNWEKFASILTPTLTGAAIQISAFEKEIRALGAEIANIADKEERRKGIEEALAKINESFNITTETGKKFIEVLKDSLVSQIALNKAAEDNAQKAKENAEKRAGEINQYEVLKKEVAALNKQLLNEVAIKSENAELTRALIDLKTSELELIEAEAAAIGKVLEGRKAIFKETESTIKLVTEVPEGAKEKTLLETLFGDEEQQDKAIEMLRDAGEQVLDLLNSQLDQRIDLIDRQIENQDRLIAETQKNIQLESDLKQQGFANDLALEKEKLAALQEQRTEALEIQEKAVRQQQILDSAQSAASLAAAVSNIIKTTSSLGPAAPFVAAAAITALLALFAKSKSQATSLAKFEKGGSGIIDGPSHRNGGVYIPGVGEVEGREAFSVFNRSATKKHGHLIAGLTDAINNDNIPAVNMILNGGKNAVRVNLDESKNIAESNKLMKKFISSSIDGQGRKILRKGSTTRIYL